MNLNRTFKALSLSLITALSLGTLAEASCPWTGTFNDVPESSTSPHSYIKGIIRERRACRVAALTDYGAGVMVSGANNWAISNIPTALKESMEESDKLDQRITDIHITENGAYVAIFGTNGYATSGAPSGMVKELQELHANAEAVQSACFNDNNEFIIVTEKTIYHNLGDGFADMIKQTNEKYGTIRAASMTNGSFILCANSGVFLFNAPRCIARALDKLNFLPRCIKYTDDGDYIITDGISSYAFSL